MEFYYDNAWQICLPHDYEIAVKRAKANVSQIPTKEEAFIKEAMRRCYLDFQVGRRCARLETLPDLIANEYEERSEIRGSLRNRYY